MIAISLKELSRSFLYKTILDQISLEIAENEAVIITGANGSGKTTLLRILSTLLKPSSGEIFYFRTDWEEAVSSIRHQMGVMFSENFLYPDLTVKENLDFYQRIYQIDKKNHRIEPLLERFQMSTFLHESVRHLSRGEKQKISLIRSVLHSPKLIFWDEPTTGLDEASQHLFQELAKEQKTKATIVCATHDLSTTTTWADRTLKLSQGKLL